MYSVAAGCHLNFRFGDILRGHNKAGQAAGAIPSARMQLTPFGREELASRMASDVARAKFVGHFAYFDAMSKMETDDIPVIDYDEVQQLILAYFPNGRVEW